MTTAAWFPVLTLVLGFSLKSAQDWLLDKRRLEREREARAAERSDRLRQRHVDFQWETLLALQEPVFDLMRTSVQALIEDRRAHRNTGEWRKQLVSEPLNENARRARQRITILGVRVRDAEVRRLLERLVETAGVATLSPRKDVSESAISDMNSLFGELNQRIGELLRSIVEQGL